MTLGNILSANEYLLFWLRGRAGAEILGLER